jgi:ribosomal protein S17
MTTIFSEVITALRQAPWRVWRLNVIVRDGVVSLNGVVKKESIRKAAIVAVENIAGVKKVLDRLSTAPAYPPPEEDFGGGDFVSLQEQPSTADDKPL